MKKLFTILALALAMVACQKDGDVNVTNGDLATVTLNLNAPALDVTRADENGENDNVNGKESAYGAIDYADAAFWAKYDLRYILEVYDANDNGTGENIAAARQYKYVDEYQQTTFEVKLVPNRKYKFVVWADFVKEDNRTDDLYYNTTDLRQISIITTAEGFNAMNEARDAYFITQNLEIKKDVNQTLVLKRPLAKLRVVTTDKQHWAKYSTPAQVVVKYYDSALSNVFNAVNGNIDAANSPLQQLTYDVTYATAASQYNETTDNKTLFADYLFAIPGAHIPVHFTMDVLESGDRLIRSNDFNTEIPIERNHLTTIYGDILTTATDIKVGINDNFDKDDIDKVYKEDEWSNDNANQTTTLTPEGTVNGKTDVDYDNNGGYTITTNEGIDVTIAAATLQNGKLAAGVYDYGTDFTVADFQYTIPAAGTTAVKFEANTVTAKVTGGIMEVLVSTDGTQTINLDLDIEYAATEGDKPVQAKVEYTMESTFVFEEIELEALATPVVEAAVEGNVVTLTWEAVENAASYSITVGTEMPVFVEEPTYVFTGEYATTYTFNVVAVPADEEKYLPSAACEVEATTAEKPAEAEAYKLYFENVAEWAEVYAHIWANEGEDLGLEDVAWPGRQLTVTEVLDGVTYYVFQLPAEATGKTLNVVFNNGNKGLQTKDLSGVVDGNLFFDNYVEPVEPSDVVLYLQPNANWNVDGARFAAYFFGNGETWVDMTLVEGETNIYAVTVPAGFEDIIFCRMNPSTTDNNWNDNVKWNKTSDLKVPTDGTNLYTVAENTWDEGGGTWSTYTPAVVAPTALATPVVTAVAKENIVTLTWEAVANAGSYSINISANGIANETPVVVEEPTYVFTGEYETEYTFNVVAVPADEEKFTASEAGVATATTEAAPAVEPEEPEAGSLVTIAKYIELANTEVAYQISGVISNIYNTNFGNFYLTDETGTITVYGLLNSEGGKNGAVAEYGIREGDTVTLEGVYKLYGTDTHEIVDAILKDHVAAPYIEAKAVSVEASATSATIEVESNIDWTVTCDADWVTFEKTATSINVTFEANNGDERTATFTLSGDDVENVAVTLTQAAYGATDTKGTYTSESFLKNSTDTTNNKYYLEKVNVNGTSYDCLKLGTSSVIGKYTTSAVGESGDLTLSFYGVGWSSKSGKLNIYLDGTKVGDTLTLNTNAGAANNSPYTIEFSDTDYYSVKLTGVTENSTITFETVSGATRVILCGVQLY